MYIIKDYDQQNKYNLNRKYLHSITDCLIGI